MGLNYIVRENISCLAKAEEWLTVWVARHSAIRKNGGTVIVGAHRGLEDYPSPI